MGDSAVDGTTDAISFGPFQFHATRRLLQKDGVGVPLGGRAFDVLSVLINRAGDLVSKKELIDSVWPSVTVEEGSLRFHIKELRKALGERQAGVRYIVNVSGKGYSFVAPISKATRPSESSTYLVRPRTLPSRMLSVIGCEKTVRNVSALLQDRRFVTLTGPGGIGKTTVAITVAEGLISEFGGDICFVDLATVVDPNLVATALIAALAEPIQSHSVSSVVEHLRRKKVLLVLDSCEHLIDAVATIAEQLVRDAKGVFVLATSREPLKADGEIIYRLAPLDYPPAGARLTAVDAQSFPSIRLFVDRVARSLPGFMLQDSDVPAVAEICRKLDGLALAIELAAGRVSAFGVSGAATLLIDGLEHLSGGSRTAPSRHQTMRATLDWSFNLLSQIERIVLCRLSIFVGLFTLDAARAVATGREVSTNEVVETVATLFEKSLISVDLSISSASAYRLLDSTRAYAWQKLSDSDDVRLIASRHACFFRDLLLRDDRPERFEADHGDRLYIPNVRAALEWAFSDGGDGEVAVTLASAACSLFEERLLFAECGEWAKRAMSIMSNHHKGTCIEMHLQLSAGLGTTYSSGYTQEAGAALRRSVQLAENLGDSEARVKGLLLLYNFYTTTSRFDKAVEVTQECVGVARSNGDPVLVARADWALCSATHLYGDQEAAYRLCVSALKRPAEVEAQRARIDGYNFHVRALSSLARNLWLRGYPDQAVEMAREAIREAEGFGNPIVLCGALALTSQVFGWTFNVADAIAASKQMKSIAERYSLAPYQIAGDGLTGTNYVNFGDPEKGVAILRVVLAQLEAKQYTFISSVFRSELADGLARLGKFDEARREIDEATARIEDEELCMSTPDMLCVRGDILASIPGTEEQEIEDCYARSLWWSRKQSALAWELRTSTALARRRLAQQRKDEALALLVPLYAQFTEGLDTGDLKSAKAVIDASR